MDVWWISDDDLTVVDDRMMGHMEELLVERGIGISGMVMASSRPSCEGFVVWMTVGPWLIRDGWPSGRGKRASLLGVLFHGHGQ